MAWPTFSLCDVIWHEDDSKPGQWYIVMVEQRSMKFMDKYLGSNGKISSTFLLDPIIGSIDVLALITLDEPSGDLSMHQIGVNKLKLPGIALTAGIKYGIVDFELAVKQYLSPNKTVGPICPVVERSEQEFTIRTLPRTSRCDCGGRAAGYHDNEPWGHGRWCKIFGGPDGKET